MIAGALGDSGPLPGHLRLIIDPLRHGSESPITHYPSSIINVSSRFCRYVE
jgi:hypothetical protein